MEYACAFIGILDNNERPSGKGEQECKMGRREIVDSLYPALFQPPEDIFCVSF